MLVLRGFWLSVSSLLHQLCSSCRNAASFGSEHTPRINFCLRMYLSEYPIVYLGICLSMNVSIYLSIITQRLTTHKHCKVGNTGFYSLLKFFRTRVPSERHVVVSEWKLESTRVVEFAIRHFPNRKEDTIPNQRLYVISSQRVWYP